MQNFIGTKMLKGAPMTRLEYVTYRGWALPADENGADEGYLVEYMDGGKPNHADHAGYISWSPKAQFEAAYLPLGNVSHLQPHQQRVIAERAQRASELEKLGNFLMNVPSGVTLEPEERDRLNFQHVVMTDLVRVLDARIAAFGGAA